MVKEEADEQKRHDECVRALADELKRDKWAVKANVEGGEKPAKIGALTPDIEAEKGCLKRICEVLTEKDFGGDKERYIEFKNYCDEYDFHFYVVDKDGKRRQIDPAKFGQK
jgi:predicted transcriptional regulator